MLFYGLTQEPVLATANTGKTRERFWRKMQVNGPDKLLFCDKLISE